MVPGLVAYDANSSPERLAGYALGTEKKIYKLSLTVFHQTLVLAQVVRFNHLQPITSNFTPFKSRVTNKPSLLIFKV